MLSSELAVAALEMNIRHAHGQAAADALTALGDLKNIVVLLEDPKGASSAAADLVSLSTLVTSAARHAAECGALVAMREALAEQPPS